jgi:hypothetical protein
MNELTDTKEEAECAYYFSFFLSIQLRNERTEEDFPSLNYFISPNDVSDRI